MLFNSLHFLIFFIIVTSAYFAMPHRLRWVLLLGSSCYFYMSFIPMYIAILGFTIVVDYFAGLFIENARGPRRKLLLLCSLAANIGVLSIFKYYGFIEQNFSFLLHGLGIAGTIPHLSILLPIGLSFHTFQAMSYTIEVYRGRQKAERHFGIYSLYVMFYPQLVAGPIERPQNLLHQFREQHSFSLENFKSGLLLMLFGLFKKVVIADRLAIAVDYSFGNYAGQSGLSMLIATVMYSFQIYCDFSGYSDMAIGAARIMGFRLMTNFNSPYFATSLSEFWKRWHISLSTWFKDYLYIPLGGSRAGNLRTCLNLLIVFTVSGLWHGANWTFVIWGALHGLGLVIEKQFSFLSAKQPAIRGSLPAKLTGWLLTFTTVTLAWIFFRAPTFSQAVYMIGRILHASPFDAVDIRLNLPEIAASFALIAFLALKEKKVIRVTLNNNYVFAAFMVTMVFTCWFFGVFNNKQFIYFQF